MHVSSILLRSSRRAREPGDDSVREALRGARDEIEAEARLVDLDLDQHEAAPARHAAATAPGSATAARDRGTGAPRCARSSTYVFARFQRISDGGLNARPAGRRSSQAT